MARGEALAADAVAEAAKRLARQTQPPGVVSEVTSDGVRLSGRGLKLRIVGDPAIGRFER
jgi:hypothetical protein